MNIELLCLESLKEAVEKAGGQTALATLINVRQSYVWNWLNRNKKTPADQVIKIEKATGVPRYLLRPDIYPRED